MPSRFVAACAIAALTNLTALRSQGPLSIAIDDGSDVQEIARYSGGDWISAPSCVTGASPGSGRVRVVVKDGPPALDVQALLPGATEWVRLTPFILQLFDRREREQRLTRAQTSSAPRAIDWIYALTANGERTYYFEASRRVPSSYERVDADTDPPGTLRITVAGFVREGRGGPIPLGAKSELRWEEDRPSRGPAHPDLTPLGAIPKSDGSWWVMKGQSGSSAWFTIYDVSDRGIRTALTIRGPRC